MLLSAICTGHPSASGRPGRKGKGRFPAGVSVLYPPTPLLSPVLSAFLSRHATYSRLNTSAGSLSLSPLDTLSWISFLCGRQRNAPPRELASGLDDNNAAALTAHDERLLKLLENTLCHPIEPNQRLHKINRTRRRQSRHRSH